MLTFCDPYLADVTEDGRSGKRWLAHAALDGTPMGSLSCKTRAELERRMAEALTYPERWAEWARNAGHSC